jgi:hypothetical protein
MQLKTIASALFLTALAVGLLWATGQGIGCWLHLTKCDWQSNEIATTVLAFAGFACIVWLVGKLR